MSIALQAPFIRRLYSLFKIHRYYPSWWYCWRMVG
jgi:hypothetical protein